MGAPFKMQEHSDWTRNVRPGIDRVSPRARMSPRTRPITTGSDLLILGFNKIKHRALEFYWRKMRFVSNVRFREVFLPAGALSGIV